MLLVVSCHLWICIPSKIHSNTNKKAFIFYKMKTKQFRALLREALRCVRWLIGICVACRIFRYAAFSHSFKTTTGINISAFLYRLQ
jgi:hypothetical protein